MKNINEEKNEVRKNEKLFLHFKSEKKSYNISLRNKEDDEKDLLLVFSELDISDSNLTDENFKKNRPNKIRFYNESLEDFFRAVEKIKKVYDETKRKN